MAKASGRCVSTGWVGEIDSLKPMLLLFLSQRCRQAIKIIFKLPSQFVFRFPYLFNYFIFHHRFSPMISCGVHISGYTTDLMSV